MTPQLPSENRDEYKLADVFKRQNPVAPRSGQVTASSTFVIAREHCREVRLSAITRDSPLQVRAPFDPAHDEDDRALLESLESAGQRVPVLLTEEPDSQLPAYAVLDGHRRIAALRKLKRDSVKAVVFTHETAECDLITLTAHVRKHLTPLEQARVVSRLRERHHLTLEDIAKSVGLTPRYLTEIRALLDVDAALQSALEHGQLKAKAALALGQAPREHQHRLAEIASTCTVSEADAKRWVERLGQTGETPEQAALALGIWKGDIAEPIQPSPATTERLTSPKDKRNPAMSLEAAAALIQNCFPKIDARAGHTLAELAVPRVATAGVVKAAGLLTIGGLKMETAVAVAATRAKDPAVRKLLLIVDALDAVRTLIGKAHCSPDCAPMLAALAKQAIRLKQRAAQLGKRNRKGTQHGATQNAQ